MIGAKVKHLFFDTDLVKRCVDSATRKVLSEFGRNVRRRAVASIRESPGPAPAGQAPHSHMAAKRRRANKKRRQEGKEPVRGGFRGLKHILYAFEPAGRSVIIGPASNRKRNLTIPEILEYGADPSGKVGKRPFMGPAFEQEKPKLSALWAGSIK